jgi:signal transduction histidine kinase
LAAIGITISAVALVACAALVVWITMMHRSTVTIVAAMERLRVVEESEISLLRHATTPNEFVRQQLEEQLTRQIAEARRVAVTDDEEALVEQVEATVRAYLTAPAAEAVARRAAAYHALDNLVAANMRHAQIAKDRTDRWNEVGDLVAISVAGLLLVLTGGFLLWLKRRALQPVFSLAEVMQRFGRGDRDVRAETLGYEELDLMSERFNEMASALAAQREGQIAFLGGVAHDLRGPLSAMAMALEMLRGARDADPRAKRAFEIADRAVPRLERMIGDFLDTAKIDAGELELRWQVDDVTRIIRDVVEPLQASSPNHQVALELPAEPVPVRCDPVRLEQVVSNLVSNAIKYSPQGGTIRVSLSVTEHALVLAIADAGLGIAVEDQARLFEPFQRVGDRQRTIAGVGLGLFIVRRIVEAHGGRIELTSKPGRGTTFTVSIPREPGVGA